MAQEDQENLRSQNPHPAPNWNADGEGWPWQNKTRSPEQTLFLGGFHYENKIVASQGTLIQQAFMGQQQTTDYLVLGTRIKCVLVETQV